MAIPSDVQVLQPLVDPHPVIDVDDQIILPEFPVRRKVRALSEPSLPGASSSHRKFPLPSGSPILHGDFENPKKGSPQEESPPCRPGPSSSETVFPCRDGTPCVFREEISQPLRLAQGMRNDKWSNPLFLPITEFPGQDGKRGMARSGPPVTDRAAFISACEILRCFRGQTASVFAPRRGHRAFLEKHPVKLPRNCVKSSKPRYADSGGGTDSFFSRAR